jgi:hypothetical protein
MCFYDRPQSIPWLFILAREMAMFLRQNECEPYKIRLRLLEAIKLADMVYKHLTRAEKDIFSLYYLDGGDFQEIGHVLKKPTCIAERELREARLKLQIHYHSLTAVEEIPKDAMRIMNTRLLMTLYLPSKQLPTALPKSNLAIAALGEAAQ